MIKLIASDLDGTLLQNGCQSLSLRTLELINELHKKGILFVAASGRQYPNMRRLFGELSSHIAFICENGALVIYKGQIISKSVMDRQLGLKLINDIYNREDCEVLLSGENVSYIKPKDEAYTNRMVNIVKNDVEIVKDYQDVSEDFIKISAYQQQGIEKSSDYFIKKWQDAFKCTISDFKWIDFIHKNTNKGSSLKYLLDHFNIKPDAAMAFGDNYNDLEMLSLVKYGYAMSNAREEIKSMYKYHTSLVENTLEEILQLH